MIDLQEIEQNFNSILLSLGDEKIVNWEIVEKTEHDLMKSFDDLLNKIYQIKDGLSRIFIENIKTLKKLDARDLISRIKEKKLDFKHLQSIQQFATYNEANQIILNVQLLKGQVNKVIVPWVGTNKSIIDKLVELRQWLDERLSQIDLTKPSTSIEAKEETKQQVPQEIKQVNSIEQTYNKINEIASTIQIMTIPNTNNLINTQTIKQIVEGAVELAQSGFIQITYENRKQRREFLYNDQKSYIQLCLEYVTDLDGIINSAQKALCEKLDLSSDIIEQSLATLMERGLGDYIMEIQTQSRLKIKKALPKYRNVDLKETKEILKTQIQILKDKPNLFIDLINFLPNDNDSLYFMTMILNLAIGDILNEQTGYEEEDFSENLESLENLTNDTEIQEIMERLQGLVMEILGKTNLAQTYAQQNQAPQ